MSVPVQGWVQRSMPATARRFVLRALAAAGACLITVVPAATRAEEAPDVRLGRDVLPTFQRVSLKLDPDKRSFSGSVHVELTVARSTDTLRLHADGQRLTRVRLAQGGDSVSTTRSTGDHGLQTLAAAHALKVGPATLDIEFTNLYGTRAVGLYRALHENRGYLFTQFESDDARGAFPCWDEPGFKFPYQMVLQVPSAQEAVTNTPPESTSEQDGWKTITFKRTPPLPSYLLALAVGPFEFTPVPGSKLPIRVITCQGEKHLAATTVEIAPRLVAGLERWFGIPYPYEKLDLVAVPEFAYGAMENAGLITFRDDLLLLDGANASVAQRRSNAAVICHELAHMWFGDLVTMAWWDDLWLNESFADWMAAKVTDEVVPQYKDGLADLQRVQTVRQSDTQPSTQPIRDRTTSATAGLANVGLVYSKGNAVLSMFERYLGPETFRKGVQSYLKSHAWGNATAADLWHALDQSSGTNVSAAMTTFLDQPGVPYVRVVPVEGGVRLTQSRATPYGVSEPAMKWKVPVTLKWSDGKTVRSQRVLLADESMVVRLPARPVWVMPNGEGRGYYAWSVPDEWMAALAEHAGDVLTPEERVAFLGNLSLLMTAGEVHGDTYLKALSYFGRDPEPQVVSSTLEALQGVRAALVPDSLASLFAVYVRRTLSPALERVGYDRRPGEDETVSTMRGDLLRWLASRGQDDKVMAFAQSAAAHYLADSTSVDPGIADAVVSLAAKHGDAAMFADYQRRLESTDVPAVRRRFLAALGGFEDPALVTKALDYMLSDKVRPTETFVIMQGLGGRDEATGERMFRWMIDHYDQLATRIPPPALRFLPMMGAGCSAERLAATEAFFTDPKHSMPGGEKTLERVSDMVHTCRSVREREGERVTTFMRAFAIN
ncbi:MAG TPA: M1 family aminopeptidase [Candidatus Eisenbacteria bacterium]|jgi:alanyl aminopeptidase